MLVAALSVVVAAVACGFDGSGSMPVATGVADGGTGEGSLPPGSGPEVDAETDGAGLLVDDSGTIVLLDSGALPVETVDAGNSAVCPANSYRCGATGECVNVCGGCPGAPIRCATTGTCVGKCATCAGRAFECWACSSTNGTTLAKVACEPTPDACYSAGTTRCNCGVLGGCYGSEQVCLGNVFSGYYCRGCGESFTDGQRCIGNNQTCKSSTRACN